MEENKKHIIWESNPDPDDYAEAFMECEDAYKDIYDFIYAEVEMWLDDEKLNLDIDCRQVVCIADVGRWDGRRMAFRFLGTNVNSIFLSDECDYHTFYSDGDDVRCEAVHHDGTNHYLFRQLKDGVDQYEFREAFLSAQRGELDAVVEKYTDSLAPIVNNVYGW